MKKTKNTENPDNSFLSPQDIENKKSFNKRAINKKVYVVTDGGFYATITNIKDWDSFIVLNNVGEEMEVSIFDVRYIE